MFCPKCGQQQSSDEARFCSRCGFQLGVVKALVADDEAPAGQPFQAAPPDRSRRRKDMTTGAAFMFLAALVVAAVTLALPPGHSSRIISLVAAWLLVSLLINVVPLFRYFFGGGAPSQPDGAPPPRVASGLTTQVGPAAHHSALPPSRGTPVDNFDRPRTNTAQVVPPPSVTEQTTNLL